MKVGATDEARCLSLNVWAPARADGAPARRAAPGARVVPRRGVRPRRVVAGVARRATGSRRSRTSSSCRRTTAWARWASSTRARSVVTPPTSGCTTRSRRCSGCATTSPRSAAIPDASPCSVCRPAAGSVLHLLASPAAAGLFAGVIVQSGITDRTLDAAARRAGRDDVVRSGRRRRHRRPPAARRRRAARGARRPRWSLLLKPVGDAAVPSYASTASWCSVHRPRCSAMARPPAFALARGHDGAGAELHLRDAHAPRAGPPARAGRPVPAARSPRPPRR